MAPCIFGYSFRIFHVVLTPGFGESGLHLLGITQPEVIAFCGTYFSKKIGIYPGVFRNDHELPFRNRIGLQDFLQEVGDLLTAVLDLAGGDDAFDAP